MYAFAPIKKISDTVFILEFVENNAVEWSGNYCIVLTEEKTIISIEDDTRFSEIDYINALMVCADC